MKRYYMLNGEPLIEEHQTRGDFIITTINRATADTITSLKSLPKAALAEGVTLLDGEDDYRSAKTKFDKDQEKLTVERDKLAGVRAKRIQGKMDKEAKAQAERDAWVEKQMKANK